MQKPTNVFRLGGASYGFKADGGQVMAFVHNEMSIIGYEIGYLALPHQALDGRNVNEACRPLPSPANDPNASRIDIEKRAQPRYPLIQQLLPVHQNQRVRISSAMSLHATTVFPKAVVAASTPISCDMRASAASCCSMVSIPRKRIPRTCR